jgi:hypothetical protein
VRILAGVAVASSTVGYARGASMIHADSDGRIDERDLASAEPGGALPPWYGDRRRLGSELSPDVVDQWEHDRFAYADAVRARSGEDHGTVPLENSVRAALRSQWARDAATGPGDERWEDLTAEELRAHTAAVAAAEADAEAAVRSVAATPDELPAYLTQVCCCKRNQCRVYCPPAWCPTDPDPRRRSLGDEDEAGRSLGDEDGAGRPASGESERAQEAAAEPGAPAGAGEEAREAAASPGAERM